MPEKAKKAYQKLNDLSLLFLGSFIGSMLADTRTLFLVWSLLVLVVMTGNFFYAVRITEKHRKAMHREYEELLNGRQAEGEN